MLCYWDERVRLWKGLVFEALMKEDRDENHNCLTGLKVLNGFLM